MKIALVSTPWAPSESPTISLGLLKATLRQHHHSCRCFYVSNQFYQAASQEMGEDVEFMMELITMDPDLLIYDWLFSRRVFGSHPRDAEYIEEYLAQNSFKNDLIKIRERFESLMDDIADEPWDEYDYIGFSCTHNQTMSSLALAKTISQKHPHLKIIFGGCAIDSKAANELSSQAPYVDHFFIGESEKSLIQFLEQPSDAKIIHPQPLTTEELSGLPVPNYDEFYDETGSHDCAVEASRGCWYGDKTICSFCGMVPEARYRPNRNVLDNIQELKEKYDIKFFEFSDLLIPSSYIDSIFPRTVDMGLRFHYNIRVDTVNPNHLDKLRIMRDGGTQSFFVGIETLHPKILQLMEKGHSSTESISLLKWAKYYGIFPIWLLLVGTPYAQESWNLEVLSLLKKMTHLYCPGIQSVVISKDSPYYKRMDLDVTPVYYYVYPDTVNRHSLAWEFEPLDQKYRSNKIAQSPSIARTLQFVDYWRQIQNQSSLTKTGNKIYDDRDPERHQSYRLTDSQSELLDYCFIPKQEQEVKDIFEPHDILHVIDLDLLVPMEGQYVSLIEPEYDFDHYRKQFGTNSSDPKKLTVL